MILLLKVTNVNCRWKERSQMSVSYNKLWKMLIDQKMSHIELQRAAEVAPNTMTKIRRDQPVNLAILDRICRVLGCDFGDIVEHLDESETADA